MCYASFVFLQRLTYTCVFVQQPENPCASVLDYMVEHVKRAGLQLLDRLVEVNVGIPLKLQLATMAPPSLPRLKQLADMMVTRTRIEIPSPAAAVLVLAEEEEGEQEGQPEARTVPVEGRVAVAMSGTRTPAGSARAAPSTSRTVTEAGAEAGVEAETGVVTGGGAVSTSARGGRDYGRGNGGRVGSGGTGG